MAKGFRSSRPGAGRRGRGSCRPLRAGRPSGTGGASPISAPPLRHRQQKRGHRRPSRPVLVRSEGLMAELGDARLRAERRSAPRVRELTAGAPSCMELDSADGAAGFVPMRERRGAVALPQTPPVRPLREPASSAQDVGIRPTAGAVSDRRRGGAAFCAGQRRGDLEPYGAAVAAAGAGRMGHCLIVTHGLWKARRRAVFTGACALAAVIGRTRVHPGCAACRPAEMIRVHGRRASRRGAARA